MSLGLSNDFLTSGGLDIVLGLSGHSHALGDQGGVGCSLLSLSHGVGLDVAGSRSAHFDPLRNQVLVFLQKVADDTVVENLSTVKVGQEKPDEQRDRKSVV